MKTLYTTEEARKIIESGRKLLVAGSENLLKELPTGDWIGGTIPYFMSERGGVQTADELYIAELPGYIQDTSIKFYDKSSIPLIANDYPANGASFIIIPAATDIHQSFARDVSTYKNIFNHPLVGWISGVDLNDLGKISPKVFNGRTGEFSSEKAVVLHVSLPDNKTARIDIINLFEQGNGDTITFPESGFTVDDCMINGETQNFAEYISGNSINTQLPLVADYAGALVNSSFQSVDAENKIVNLYAPVFPGVQYKIAAQVKDYEKDFQDRLNEKNITPIFSCNCILNYLYANLEGKKTGHITGPITFGEIAYMLLNQTMVYVSFDDK